MLRDTGSEEAEMNRTALILSLFFLLLPFIAISNVKADEVYIDIGMSGDVNVTINHTNGTLAIYYNGRDLLKEIEEQYRTIEALRTMIAYYSVKAEAYGELQPEIEELNATINQMIQELNLIINDLYGGLNAIYLMVGLSENSSAIKESIMAGNYTVIDYLERHEEKIDHLNTEIQALNNEVLKLQMELLKEMEERNKSLEAEIQDLNASMTNRIDELSSDYQHQINLLSESLTQMQQNFLSLVAVFVALDIVIILLIVTQRP